MFPRTVVIISVVFIFALTQQTCQAVGDGKPSTLTDEFKNEVKSLYNEAKKDPLARVKWEEVWGKNRENPAFLVYIFELIPSTVREGSRSIEIEIQNPSFQGLNKMGKSAVPFLCKSAREYFDSNIVAFSYVTASLGVIGDERAASALLDLYQKSVSFMIGNADQGLEKQRPLACMSALAKLGSFQGVPYFLNQLEYKVSEQKNPFDGSTVQQQAVIHIRNWAHLALKDITKQVLSYTPANPQDEDITAWKNWWSANKDKDKKAFLEDDLKTSVEQLTSNDSSKVLHATYKLKLHANQRSFLAVINALSEHDANSTVAHALVDASWGIWKRMVERGIEVPKLPSKQDKTTEWQSWWLKNKAAFPQQLVPKNTSVEQIETQFANSVRTATGKSEEESRQEDNKQKTVAKLMERKIGTLEFKDAPLASAITQLAALAEVKNVIDSDCPKDLMVSLKLADVSIKTAFETILEPHGLDYIIRKDGVIFVSTKERIRTIRKDSRK
jgi:hypothetical protein